ncbi:MAG TPA: GspH/FimT family protein [Nevskiaceae bacterium]|nr:GspH/FimT family protein [Nevskiaceae bacterium]
MAPKSSGFTLVELLIALAVAATLAALAAPSFHRTVLRTRIVATTNALAQALHVARQTAATTGRYVALCAGDQQGGCTGDWTGGRWIVFVDGHHDGVLGDGEQIVLSGAGQRGVELSGNGPFRKAVEFTPLGVPRWPSGAFGAGRLRACVEFDGSAKVSELVLSATGRVRIEHQDAEAPCSAL